MISLSLALPTNRPKKNFPLEGPAACLKAKVEHPKAIKNHSQVQKLILLRGQRAEKSQLLQNCPDHNQNNPAPKKPRLIQITHWIS